MQAPAPGTVIAERYRIECSLGQGGMSQLFQAFDPVLERKVAVKLIRFDFRSDDEKTRFDLKRRFRLEALTAARLRSPHIVTIYDLGIAAEDTAFIVQELLEGTDLASLVKREGRLDPRRAVELAVQACWALEEAHDAGILHRDIKPSNLFVTHTPNGQDHLVLLDFGIAKVVGAEADTERTDPGIVVGTPLYMAPEQLSEEDLDGRADLYALGATLYEILAGRAPFDMNEGGIVGVIKQKMDGKPPPLREHAGNVSPELEAVVMRCLERRREDRFGSAAELREALLAAPEVCLLPGAAPRPAVSLETDPESKESSVLFSLKETMSLEEDRSQAEEEAHQGEEIARAEAIRREAVAAARIERAQLEVEHSARLEGLAQQQAHERAKAKIDLKARIGRDSPPSGAPAPEPIAPPPPGYQSIPAFADTIQHPQVSAAAPMSLAAGEEVLAARKSSWRLLPILALVSVAFTGVVFAGHWVVDHVPRWTVVAVAAATLSAVAARLIVVRLRRPSRPPADRAEPPLEIASLPPVKTESPIDTVSRQPDASSPPPPSELEHDPFALEGPITGELEFFGSRREIQTLLRRAAAGKGFGLFGQLKWGTTSLLLRIRAELSHQATAWVDIAALTEATLGSLLNAVHIDLARELRQKSPRAILPSPPTADTGDAARTALEAAIEACHTAGLGRPVIFLDRVDELTRSSRCDPVTLIAFVRDLCRIALPRGTPRAVLVLAGADDDVLLRKSFLHGEMSLDNPFYRTLDREYTPFFTRDETADLLERLGARAGLLFSSPAIHTIYRLTGGHKYLTRLLGSELCRLRSQRGIERLQVDAAEVDDAISPLLMHHGDYFSAIVDNAPEATREVLARLAEGPASLDDLLGLGASGPARAGHVPAIVFVTKYRLAVEEKKVYRLAIGLMGEWLKLAGGVAVRPPPATSPTGTVIMPSARELQSLRDVMGRGFQHVHELKLLAADMNIVLGSVASTDQPIPAIILDIVNWSVAHGRFAELSALVRRERPHLFQD